jgi:aldehyde:ferredoxin oxidoreductase
MPIPTCYTGKILNVDLNKGTISEEVLPEKFYHDFIGGNGLGARILYQRIEPKTDPLGPGNILGFVTGPLTGLNIPGSGRYTVVAKSPLTGAWGEANSGGFWGTELKWAGFDAVFITGISSKPVYLLISEGKAELKDASHIWGKNTDETEQLLLQELNDSKMRVACIGPAGEKLSLMAGIVNEKGRIAARSGLGAVMGSKKLKAIAVSSGKAHAKIEAADASKLKSAREDFAARVKASKFHQHLSSGGTGGGLSFLVSIGDSPTKNWSSTGKDSMPTANKLDSANMDKYKLESYGCQACPIRCGALIKVQEGNFQTTGELHRPEYESVAAFGSLCLNDNIESVIKANELCNLYGIDTIGVGGAVAFAIECFENGLITKRDTDGIELKWGDGAAIVALTEKICRRESIIGSILADGVKKAAEKIGGSSQEYAIHIGGHRLPYHDPRGNPSLGASFLCGTQPSCHMNSQGAQMLETGLDLGTDPVMKSPKLGVYSDFDKKGFIHTIGEAYGQLINAAGLCSLYSLFFYVPVVELLSPATGWDIDWTEGLKIGKRIMTLTQAFNVREGITPDMFTMPKRLTRPLTVGPATGVHVDFSQIKESWFKAMDWSLDNGKPTKRALTELGLAEFVA